MTFKSFQKPKRLECDPADLTPIYGRFTAQPFERGFGTTIGNALRRVLLSSIDGAAVTAVRIEGVLHEFSSIPGVVEDVTDIILNLKRIPLKLHVDHPEALHVKAVNGALVPSGGPSCVQCSKMLLVCGVAGIWLYHADGWQRYKASDFHARSLGASQ